MRQAWTYLGAGADVLCHLQCKPSGSALWTLHLAESALGLVIFKQATRDTSVLCHQAIEYAWMEHDCAQSSQPHAPSTVLETVPALTSCVTIVLMLLQH